MGNFGGQSPKELKEEKSFKVFFSIFSSGGHLVQRSGAVSAILLEGHPRNLPVFISKSMHWLRRRSGLKVFLFLALAAILFNGAEEFEQFW